METTTTIKTMATRLTAEQVKADSKREYNPEVWEQRVDGYSKYTDVEFYKIEKGNGYEYSRFYVVYTLPEGLRLLGTLSYSSSITSGGFYTAWIKTMDDNFKWYTNGQVELVTRKITFINEKGESEQGVIATTKEARKWMTERSKERQQIFTKEFFFS
jgi:hypothetical protein